MFCKNCNTPFEIIPIDEGKSKYCKKCGKLIYKKENDTIHIVVGVSKFSAKNKPAKTKHQTIKQKIPIKQNALWGDQKARSDRNRGRTEKVLKGT